MIGFDGGYRPAVALALPPDEPQLFDDDSGQGGGGPPPEGACCIDGVCDIETQYDCENSGGVYQGDNSECDPDPCAGACCAEDGTCDDTTNESDCEDAGNTWMSGETCDPNPCPQPTGACCVDGDCSITTEADCTGDYQGDGTPCDPNPCDGSCGHGGGPCPEGACCFSEVSLITGGSGYTVGDILTITGSTGVATVEVLTLFGSAVATFNQLSNTMTANDIGLFASGGAGSGAEFNNDFGCHFITEAACNDAGGFYYGDNIACDPSPCCCPEFPNGFSEDPHRYGISQEVSINTDELGNHSELIRYFNFCTSEFFDCNFSCTGQPGSTDCDDYDFYRSCVSLSCPAIDTGDTDDHHWEYVSCEPDSSAHGTYDIYLSGCCDCGEMSPSHINAALARIRSRTA